MTSHNIIGAVTDSFPGGEPAPITANIGEHGVILRLPLAALVVGDCVTICVPGQEPAAVIGRVTRFDAQGRAVVEAAA